jgi:hypothetical protein
MSYRLLLFLALVWPHSVLAHGSEFIGAKCSRTSAGLVCLEITADYGDNPMLTSRAEAADAVTNNLEVWQAEHWTPVAELAPVVLEERSTPDASSPLPTDSSGKPHQLLTGLWTWQPPPEMPLRFRVAEDVNYATIFWIHEPDVPKEKQKWAMLLSGDATPELPEIKRKESSWTLWILAITCTAAAFIALLFYLRRPPLT